MGIYNELHITDSLCTLSLQYAQNCRLTWKLYFNTYHYTSITWILLRGNCNWSSKLSVQKTSTFVLECTGGGWRTAPVLLRPDPLVTPSDEAEDLSRSRDNVRGFSVPRPPFPALSETLRSNQPVQKMYNKLQTICMDAVWRGCFVKAVL